MLCLYLVTGAAACAVLFNPDLRSTIPAVFSGSEESKLNSPAVNTPEIADTSSEQVDIPDPSEPSVGTDQAAQSAEPELFDTIDPSTQQELSESTDPSAGAEQEQISEPSDFSETLSAEKSEVKYRGIADQDKGKRLFIRKSPSLDGEVLGVLWTGQSGEVLDIGDEWVLLKYGDIEGYVFKTFLIIEELPQSADPQGL